MIVVSNAGPCIALARIGALNVLSALFGQVHIPAAVYDEIVTSGSGRPGAEEIALAQWTHTVEIQDKTAVQLLRERLDAGESEAIVLALELQADLLLIDESRGRRVAEAHNLKKTGTVGILVLAKKHGLIDRVTPLLDALLASGFRMSEALYHRAQSLVGER